MLHGGILCSTVLTLLYLKHLSVKLWSGTVSLVCHKHTKNHTMKRKVRSQRIDTPPRLRYLMGHVSDV